MSNENNKNMIDEIKNTISRLEFPYDWDDVSDIPEEMLTIDNLLGIIENYKSKYNDALENFEFAITDIVATIDYYEVREDLGLK